MIELVILDVDGCLTDGKIVYTNSGDEIKSFDVKDGFAIVSWVKLGRKFAIITGRKSDIVERRAKELGAKYLFQDVKNKLTKLDEILKMENLTYDNVAVIGDDLNDYAMLKKVKFSYAPQNAIEDVKKIVSNVIPKNGGDAAVRWMFDDIMTKENLKEEFFKLWV